MDPLGRVIWWRDSTPSPRSVWPPDGREFMSPRLSVPLFLLVQRMRVETRLTGYVEGVRCSSHPSRVSP